MSCSCNATLIVLNSVGEQKGIPQKGVRVVAAETLQLEMAKARLKPMFALLGCQQINVNTLWCDTLGLADSANSKL